MNNDSYYDGYDDGATKARQEEQSRYARLIDECRELLEWISGTSTCEPKALILKEIDTRATALLVKLNQSPTTPT